MVYSRFCCCSMPTEYLAPRYIARYKSFRKTSVFEKQRPLPDFGPISPVFVSQNCFRKPHFRKANAPMSFERQVWRYEMILGPLPWSDTIIIAIL